MGHNQWFKLVKNQVTGPFKAEDILASPPNDKETLFWGKGFSEWKSFNHWKSAVKEIEAEEKNRSENQKSWRFRVLGQEYPYMTYEELIEQLSELEDYREAEIWSDRRADWKEIYFFSEIIDQLGISRRNNPRVPIKADFASKGYQHGDFVVRAVSISKGGIGTSKIDNVKIGDRVKGVLTSPHLYTPIECEFEAVNTGAENLLGFKFINLPIEAKTAIIEYINKFNDMSNS